LRSYASSAGSPAAIDHRAKEIQASHRAGFFYGWEILTRGMQRQPQIQHQLQKLRHESPDNCRYRVPVYVLFMCEEGSWPYGAWKAGLSQLRDRRGAGVGLHVFADHRYQLADVALIPYL
jgi:hypothetical protein